MEDGFCVTYIKNGIMYPVVIEKELRELLQSVMPAVISNNREVVILENYPIGKVEIINPNQKAGL